MNCTKFILPTILALLFCNGGFSQWQFTRQDNNTQPYINGVIVLNNRILFTGPSLAVDSIPQFAIFHCTELDFDGNIIKDTLIGNTTETVVQYDMPNRYYNSNSYHNIQRQFPNGANPAMQYGMVMDTNYNRYYVDIHTNFPPHEGHVNSYFKQIDTNKFMSIATLFYPNMGYTSHMHIRIIDSLGNVEKEKILSIPNRRLFCTTFHEFEGHYYFHCVRAQLDPNTNSGQLATKIMFKLDTTNLEIVSQRVESGLLYADIRSSVLLQNGDFVVECLKILGYVDHPNPLMQFPIVVRTLRKYDPELNLLAEWQFGSVGPHIASNREIKLQDSETIVGIGTDTIINHAAMCIYKIDTTGDLKWFRKFTPLYDSLYPYSNVPYGFDFMPDGGYVVCGRSNGSFPMQYRGWVMRLNCLGFMGSPQAAFNADGQSDMSWAFVNNSTEAGSFTWLMDDGTVHQTPENADTLFHTFADPSIEHTVTLIAHGCNGEADTLVYVLPPHPLYDPNPQPEPPTPENGFFAIYPNPAQVGAPIHIVMNAQNNAENIVFEFHNSAGQLAASYAVPNEAAVFMLENNFAQGMYHVSMKVDGKVVVRKKFVVRG